MTTFASLPLHSALARALTARGYETATPVQAAVLDPLHTGRDLTVSSQTGSGKTIAFGALLAQTLLTEGTPWTRGTRPAALVIVPTRELAQQVREELGWFLQQTGLRLASFTGGTGVSGDLRALHHGVDVAIGTPGRLVDLVKRERLDLGGLRAVVLDEADEMLDLGFRDDLETLLKAAPAERRTVMMSATMPSEIRALARRFQRDAVAIDPRTAAGGTASSGPTAHEDISYVANVVAPGEKLPAVVNVLRAFDLQAADEARAIVFGTTREGVAQLHAALVARGFAATVISGDRAQAERDRALEQMRQGQTRILVATNVAARGLHLPDVDLIVHADLPLNAESLAHRSGRTGRAGRKGTAVLIVAAHERRKAERLLAAVNARATWSAAPSADAIATAARQRLITDLLATPGNASDAAAGAAPRVSDADVEAVVCQLEAQQTPRQVLSRLIARELGRLPAGERLTPVQASNGFARERDGRSGPAHSRSDFASKGVLFRINMGAKDKADPRWMLPLICRRGGVTRREVGAIRIGPRDTTFEISGDAAHDFALASTQLDPRAPHVRIDRVSGGAQSQPPQSSPQPPQQHKPAPHHRPPATATHKPAPHHRPTGMAPHKPAPHHKPAGMAAHKPAPHHKPAGMAAHKPAPHHKPKPKRA